MTIEPLVLQDCTYIALNLRERDKREIFTIREDEDPVRLASDVMASVGNGGFGYCARFGDRPVAAYGAVRKWSGVWEAFAFATDWFPKIAPRVTRHVRDGIMPALAAGGAHRVQCHSHAEHAPAHRWLEFIGCRQEARLEGFGRDGSDYLIFAWRP